MQKPVVRANLESMPYPIAWSADPPNLLSPEIIKRVSDALKAGVVCGLQAFYGGGCGPEPRGFVDLDSYIHAVEKSRQGDWFVLWSIPNLAEQDALLIRTHGIPVTEDDLQNASEWLTKGSKREFLAVGTSAHGASLEARWGDYDSFDELNDLAQKCLDGGEFAVLPLTDLLYGSDMKWSPRFHLINAKRPNDLGQVPLGGSY